MHFKRADRTSPRAEGRRSRRRSRDGRRGGPRGAGRIPARAATASALLVLLLLSVAGPAPGAAQEKAAEARDVESGTWLPAGTSFAPLLAAPREVGLRGSLVLADRPDLAGDFEGRNLEAEVALGHRFGVARLQRADAGRPEITLGFEVGTFSRFHLETPERDLIGVDYRVGLPLSVRGGGWEGRFTPVHVSAHVGDDFLGRFGSPGGQFTRDGVELVVARRIGGFRVYGSGTWNYHANPGVPEGEGGFGLEWDPRPGSGAGSGFAAWPFVALDLRVTDRTRGPGATGVAGAALRVRGTLLRLELRGHAGPTPLGQLRGTDETFVGIGLRVEP